MASSKRLFQSLATRVAHSPLTSSSLKSRSFRACRKDQFTTTRFSTRSNNPPPFLSSQFSRYNSTSTRAPSPLTDSKPVTPEDTAQNAQRRAEERAFLITFTCKPCSHRSSHRISQHGYYKGTVLITCPECKNRHIISDHLNIFMDTKSTLEDILWQQGQTLLKGKLERDIEWWEDGTVRAIEGEGPKEALRHQKSQGQRPISNTAQLQQDVNMPRNQDQEQEKEQEKEQGPYQ
ncbi:hypothetical protein PABG_01734 [Paracoccidioides brasiliensis Pb03]|nr:hypothetical protein PABG_01734 [Paracoccidioides brasiliensis Pb03]